MLVIYKQTFPISQQKPLQISGQEIHCVAKLQNSQPMTDNFVVKN
jgi:hypothetical protein